MSETPSGAYVASTFLKHDAVSRAAVVTLGIQTPDLQDADFYAQLFFQVFTANMTNTFDAQVQITHTEFHGGTSDDPLQGQSSGAPVRGTHSGTAVPPSVAVLVHKLTGRGGRRNKGRWYFPWAASNAEIDEAGNLIAGRITTLNTSFTALFVDLQEANLEPVVLHSEGKTALKPPTPITGFTIDPVIGSQRRRLNR